MSKYEPLRTFLAGRSDTEVPMSFHDIETIIEAPLPPAAFKHRAWWSNNPSNSVITYAWLEAGYKTERVDMASQKLIFRRAVKAQAASAGEGWLGRLRTKMAGTAQVAAGWDLTNPTGESWDAAK